MEVRLFKIWSIDTITHNKIVDLALDQYCKIAFAMRRWRYLYSSGIVKAEEENLTAFKKQDHRHIKAVFLDHSQPDIRATLSSFLKLGF